MPLACSTPMTDLSDPTCPNRPTSLAHLEYTDVSCTVPSLAAA